MHATPRIPKSPEKQELAPGPEPEIWPHLPPTTEAESTVDGPSAPGTDGSSGAG